MKSKTKQSKFVSLLLKRFIIIETFALIFITIVFFIITIPWAVNDALSTNSSTAETTTKLLDNSLTNAVDITTNIGNSGSFAELLKTYVSKQNSQSRALIELSLNDSAYSSNARSIIVDLQEYDYITSITSVYEEDRDYLDSESYQRVLKRESLSSFSEIYEINIEENFNLAVPQITIAYSKNFNRNNLNYTVTVFYDMKDTLNMINSINRSSFNDYVILNTNDSVIYTLSDQSYISAAQDFVKSYDSTQTNTYANGGYFTTSYQDIRSWKFVGYVSLYTIISNMISDQMASFVIVVFTFLFTFYMFIAPGLSRAMRPVSALTNAMAEFGKGNLSVKADKTQDDEIGKMIDVFNSMTEQINLHIANIKSYQKAQEKSHYSFLISQIDPHFVCNSMNMISALIRLNRSDDALELNTALVDIVRDRLRIRHTEILDTIEQEIGIIKRYIEIASFMYQNKVEILWNVDSKLRNAKIPKNVMQPVVENSLLHGLLNSDTGEMKGKITIDIFEQNSSCNIIIADDGFGMSKNELSKLISEDFEHDLPEEKGKHIALRNIKKRLKYIMNGDTCFYIDSIPGEGTTVKFIFPLIRD